jgi:RNA polymerase sigma factor for flagellar operon FliA
MSGNRDQADDAPAAELFQANLPLIDRVITRVCRQGGVRDADAEDFGSAVKVALIDRDYSILRGWQKRSALATYLTVVIQRLLSDYRNRMLGRWEPSAAARRDGPAAMLLETIVRRDGQSLDDALPRVRGLDPTLTRADLESMLARVPERAPRPHAVALEAVDVSGVSAPDRADASLMMKEEVRLSRRTSQVVRRALAEFPSEDRTIVRCHFGTGMSVADIARALRLPQRPLYRRIEIITMRLRRALVESGIDQRSAQNLIGSSVQALDFGLTPQSIEEGPE